MPRSVHVRVALGTLVATLLVACPGKKDDSSNKRGRDKPAPPSSSQYVGVIEGDTAEAMLDNMEATYRLYPDRRFMAAILALDDVAGMEQTPVATSFGVEKFSVSRGENELGELDALPDFDQLYGLVMVQAEMVVEELGLTRGELEKGQIPSPGRPAIDVLTDIDKGWAGQKNASVLQQAARAYLALLLGMRDPLEVGGKVAVRAIATLAVAEAATDGEMLTERAILARALGYDADAQALAVDLEASDPVRAWIDGDLEALGASANKSSVRPVTVVMYCDLLIEQGRRELLESYIAKLPKGLVRTAPILALSLVAKRTPENADALLTHTTIEMNRLVGKTLEPGKVALYDSRDGILPALDPMLEKLSKRGSGPFLDGKTLALYHTVFLMAGLDAIGRDMLDRLGSIESAGKFAKAMGKSGGLLGKDYARYYMDRISAESRTLQLATLAKDIAEMETMGPAALEPLFKSIREQGMPGQNLFLVTKAYTARMDTRPEHRSYMRDVAWWALMDMPLAETMAMSAAAAAPLSCSGDLLWLACKARDVETLRGSFNEPHVSAYQQSYIVDCLHDSQIPDDQLRVLHESIVDEAGGQWGATDEYVEYLEDEEQYEIAESAIRKWLARKDRKKGLTEHHALARLAKMLRLQGDNEEAWEVVEPLIQGMYQGALLQGGLVASALGKHKEAENIAKACQDRYNNDTSVVLLARVYWAQGKYNEAATALAAPSRPLSKMEWRFTVGKHFAQAFGDDHTEQAIEAVKAMMNARVKPAHIYSLAQECSTKGQPKLAMTVIDTIDPQGGVKIRMFCSAHHFLVKAEGNDAALEWMKSKFPPAQRNSYLSTYCYESGTGRLAWTLVPDPEVRDETTTWTWLIRIQSWMRDGKANDEWKKRLDTYYSQEPTTHADRMGAYLMGKLDADTLWNSTQDPKEHLEICYVYGFEAQMKGDVQTATNYYRLVMENGTSKLGEAHWSMNRLYLWRQSNLSVDDLSPIIMTDEIPK